MESIDVIDSHTGGEPTRVVLRGAPGLQAPHVRAAVAELRSRHDRFRRAVIDEPRGSEILVGALLLPAFDKRNKAAVIFFNNAGYLGMCGHGMIGVAVTMAAENLLDIGKHRIETPAGTVTVELYNARRVAVGNVPSYRLRKNVPLPLRDGVTVHGDIAWGGNWFFLIKDHGQTLTRENVDALIAYTKTVRAALDASDLRGTDGALIDHIELCGAAPESIADGRNFVLCPGGEYDRSPCGTGTSALAACLVEDGILEPGAVWRQQSITGSVFEVRALVENGRVLPTIVGEAYLTARTTLLYDSNDPLVI